MLGILKLLATEPNAYAPVLGFLSSIALTQLIKFLWPSRWREIIRHRCTIATAMGIAFAVTVLANFTPAGAAEGIVVAILAPASWTLTVRALGWWKPDLRKALSGDRE